MTPRVEIEPFVVEGTHYVPLPDGRLQCRVCPRFCALKPGQRAFCFVREARDGKVVLTSYGRSTGFCVDPIEKKPLNHFLPGTPTLSFGTAGCNLGCRFCQNWDISKSRHVERLSSRAYPDDIARAAVNADCRSVAFTYNDPVIFQEYAIDTAAACRAAGLKTVAVTAGYIADARAEFFAHMDAANVDLKAFTERFYHKLCLGHLQPVLDTLAYIKHETNVWLEITTLLIPGENDSEPEVATLCEWIAVNLGPDVPLHLSAFHPDYKLTEKERTPTATLLRARAQARSIGLRYVYTGNVYDPEGQSTYCASCGALVIGRDGYQLGRWAIAGGACVHCGEPVPGLFPNEGPGTWGQNRLRVQP